MKPDPPERDPSEIDRYQRLSGGWLVGNSRTLERQFAECDVEVDAGTRMPHEQYAGSLRKLQRVFHARDDVVLGASRIAFVESASGRTARASTS